jgi:hypothetical protein
MKPNGNYDAAYHRRVQLRNRLLKAYVATHPFAAGVKGAARKALLDQLEADHNRPRVWSWCFDHRAPGNNSRWVSDRPAFKLYIRAVKLRAQVLRAARQHNTARILEAHINTLHDIAPRAAWCYWPGEWREISKALRPQGSNPVHPAARKLFAIYQHITRTKTEERQ